MNDETENNKNTTRSPLHQLRCQRTLRSRRYESYVQYKTFFVLHIGARNCTET